MAWHTPLTLCEAGLSMMTTSPARSSGTSIRSTQATKLAPSIGPSSTQGAAKLSERSAQTNVVVCQCP